MGWRYLAQDLLTRQITHPDLPLRDVEITRAVSAPGGIDATIAPEVFDLREADGRPLLDPWRTAIYAEQNDRIRHAGIFVRADQPEGAESFDIECPGFTTYPHGIPYADRMARWSADPFLIVRDLWAHLQSFPDGDIGMRVSSATSDVKASPPRPPARPEKNTGTLTAPTKGARPRRQPSDTDELYATRILLWEQDYERRRIEYETAKRLRNASDAQVDAAQKQWDLDYRDDAPYELSWWEAPDVGVEIDRLATEIPFDYLERHAWNANRSDVVHDLDLAQPRIGRRRDDLRFAIGENVLTIPETVRDGDEYANAIIGLGKGEGRDMLRSEVSVRDGRLRRPRAVALKDIGQASRLRALAAADLRQRQAMVDVRELVVIDHPNAPLGSWSLGDEIALKTQTPGWEEETLWCRITAERDRPDTDDRIVLEVVNAERAAA